MNFEYVEAKERSNYICQYKCSCRNKWWGTESNNQCKSCGKTVTKLPFGQMIGVGWFHCDCGRVFAGFIRGNVSSDCHGCKKKIFPEFIVPGDDAAGTERKSTHSCNMCNGNGSCPIVMSAKSGSGRRRY